MGNTRDASEPYGSMCTFSAADCGTNGSLSFPSSIFRTSATMFLVLKIVTISLLQSTSCCEHTHATVRGREEDERPAHTSRSRLYTDVTKF